MNYDDRHTMREEARMPQVESMRCERCNNDLDDVEASDPCTIDYHTFCDSCAGSLTQLRLQGYIKSVADRTHEIVRQSDRDLSWAQGYVEIPQRRVNHI